MIPIRLALKVSPSIRFCTFPDAAILGGPRRIPFNAGVPTRITQRAVYVAAAGATAITSRLPLRKRIPLRSWDGHMHVVEPQRFPVAPTAVYQPEVHTLADALAFESSLGVENLVLVQPSIYGTDNSCLLAALSKLGPSRGRGVVVVDPATIQSETLDEWHTLGVRGLRVNLQSVGKVMGQSELEETLLSHAEIARPRNWIIEVYVPLKMVPMLESVVPRLGVSLCIDHFGSPELSGSSWAKGNNPFNPYSLPGFHSLISLLRAGNTYIKLSAPYRLTKDGQMRDLKAMAREFLAAAPDRVIFATDWPHTRFTGVDISPFTEWCLDLSTHDPELAEKLFRRNTERMLDVHSG
ncbi:hypothetical protein PMG11_03865 [Penicillium brasilianum]|uniref:Amidohydrolase-related domain-containing protein n=1 Tax=Penicillium brasilianum TaxID=104259 RepID=A0A0F7VEL9_PENBI|nr:hypothetical protein PMG11_03865 [Penicillium brasilianum]